MWSKTRLGDIALEDLFIEANKVATKNAHRSASNSNARSRYITLHGNCVAVSGQAGLGKTTLTKQLVEKVLTKPSFRVDFLFYISLRKVKFDEKTDVLQFLLTNLYSKWKFDLKADIEILELLDKSDNVMIILDGLDEAVINYDNTCRESSIYEINTPEIILKNLLNGNILPKAKKLITSRPRQLLELHENYRPHFIVNLLGINSDAQKQICQDICGSDCDKVYHNLSEHPELSAQCFVPIICIFAVYSLHQQMINPDKSIAFASVTNIILFVLENFVSLRVQRSETFELDKLSKLAWKGLRHLKYEFTEKDLERLNLKKESLDTVLTTGTNDNIKLRIAHSGKITYFSHLIIQEFFSAAHLILFSPLKKFKKVLLSKNNQTNLEVVKKFLFGLSNPATHSRLVDLYKPSNTKTLIINLKQKNRFLKSYVSNVMTGSFVRRIRSKLRLSSVFSLDFSNYQTVCFWLYESQQIKLAEKVAKLTSKRMLISGNIFPHDVSSLCYVLRARQQPLILELHQTKFVGDGCERFLKEICGMQDGITVSMNSE